MVKYAWLGTVFATALFIVFLTILLGVKLSQSIEVDGEFMLIDNKSFFSFYCIDNSSIELEISDKVEILLDEGISYQGEVFNYGEVEYSVPEGNLNQYIISLDDKVEFTDEMEQCNVQISKNYKNWMNILLN